MDNRITGETFDDIYEGVDTMLDGLERLERQVDYLERGFRRGDPPRNLPT